MKRVMKMMMLAVGLMGLAAGCSDNSNGAWEDLPQPIAQFVTRYFPEQGIDKFVVDDGNYYVTIKNGPAMIFDSSYMWTSINGNGETLPAVLLFDELPPALYAYLQEMESVEQVYKATRDTQKYELTLEDSIVDYDIATGIVSYPYR